MNKSHQTTTRTNARRFVDESRPFVFQFREGCVNIRYLDCNMMHSRPAFGEKLTHGSFGSHRFEQFDVGITHCQHAYSYALFRNFFCRVDLQAQGIAPDRQTFFDASGGDSDVINFQQPE
jgi:hypothetical protein